MLETGSKSPCREGCLYVYALMLFGVKNLNIYQTNSSVLGMNTRQQNKLHIPSIRLS
jgi:hypothetical protein